MRITLLFFALAATVNLVSAQGQKTTYNVKELGARGDGLSSDTRVVNKVIEDAAAAGGGTIFFPAGKYILGSVHLKSNVSLFLPLTQPNLTSPKRA